MAELDPTSLSIGELNGTLKGIKTEISLLRTDVKEKLEEHDKHIVALLADKHESRGKAIAYGSLSGFGVFLATKLIEHFPSVIKSIIG
jgi:hypothetical protein